jgi:type II secretory pathway component GspD/PulD (secretin)
MKSLVVFISVFFFLAMAAFGQTCNPEVKIFKIAHGRAESLLEVVSSLMSKEGKASFDHNTNSLIVLDCPQNLERIAGVIKDLDVREKQVEIKVLVAETSAGVLQDIGLTAGRVIIPQGRFFAIVDLLKTSKDTNIRSEMTVRTLSDRAAQLQVTKDEIVGMEVAILGDHAVITSPITEPIGNFLEVLPSVNNDNTITVIVRPSVSTIDEYADSSERTILTQVVVNNGDTIAIGGADVEKEEVQKDRALFGIPLFSKKTATEKKKVVMFLTAKIID